MNIFIILLGCNIYSILLNRIETSLEFIKNNYLEQNKPITITWLLSGGIKSSSQMTQENSSQENPSISSAKSEAYLMKLLLEQKIGEQFVPNSNQINYDGGWKRIGSKKSINWSFVLDENSTNTAENFLFATRFLNSTTTKYEQIWVGTSDYHYKRASKLLGYFDSSREYKWILADLENDDSRYWESIHIRNTYSDYLKAIKKNY